MNNKEALRYATLKGRILVQDGARALWVVVKRRRYQSVVDTRVGMLCSGRLLSNIYIDIYFQM